MANVSTRYLIPGHSYKQPISALGRCSRKTEKMVGAIPRSLTSREGISGVFEPQVVYPCNSVPTPINMEAQLIALEEGSTLRL